MPNSPPSARTLVYTAAVSQPRRWLPSDGEQEDPPGLAPLRHDQVARAVIPRTEVSIALREAGERDQGDLLLGRYLKRERGDRQGWRAPGKTDESQSSGIDDRRAVDLDHVGSAGVARLG